jgi:hypothetical protein
MGYKFNTQLVVIDTEMYENQKWLQTHVHIEVSIKGVPKLVTGASNDKKRDRVPAIPGIYPFVEPDNKWHSLYLFKCPHCRKDKQVTEFRVLGRGNLTVNCSTCLRYARDYKDNHAYLRQKQ